MPPNLTLHNTLRDPLILSGCSLCYVYFVEIFGVILFKITELDVRGGHYLKVHNCHRSDYTCRSCPKIEPTQYQY